MQQWLKHFGYGLAEAGRYLAGGTHRIDVEDEGEAAMPERRDFAPAVLVLATDQGWHEERQRMDRRRAAA